MKKIMIAIMVILSANAYSIHPNTFGFLSKTINPENQVEISNYLNLNETQAEQLKSIFFCTADLLKTAKNENNDSFASSAVDYHLSSMKVILNNSQYRKYLLLLDKVETGN